MALAKVWRDIDRKENRGPGWDAKAIHSIAQNQFGGLKGLFEHHGWEERGSDMMRHVQRRVSETYGSVHAFVERFADE